MLKRWYIFVLSALLLVGIPGCSDKGKVIPEELFIDMMMEMFIADQWLREHDDARDKADTTLFFEPIFNKYGYTFKDYDASLYYYAGEINHFSEMTYEAVGRMEKLKNQYADLVERKSEVTRINEERMLDYEDKLFYSDSSEVDIPGSMWPDAPQIDSLPIVIIDRKKDTLGLVFKDSVILDSKLKSFELSSIEKKVINK